MKGRIDIPPPNTRETKRRIRVRYVLMAIVILTFLCHFGIHICSRIDYKEPAIRTVVTYDENGVPEIKDIPGGFMSSKCPFCGRILIPGEW